MTKVPLGLRWRCWWHDAILHYQTVVHLGYAVSRGVVVECSCGEYTFQSRDAEDRFTYTESLCPKLERLRLYRIGVSQ